MILAASSKIFLLTSGFDSIISVIFPCPTIPDDFEPVPLSAKINCTSLALAFFPLILYVGPLSLSNFLEISISLMFV